MPGAAALVGKRSMGWVDLLACPHSRPRHRHPSARHSPLPATALPAYMGRSNGWLNLQEGPYLHSAFLK